MNRSKSFELFSEAVNLIPGGVNSPVRAFRAVGGTPVFMKSAKGAYLFDADGNKYIDLIGSWGPMILGHAHLEIEDAIIKAVKDSTSFGTSSEREIEMAELIISMVPCIEKVRMVNSGTEACMAAIRLARGYTGKNKIIKFEGCYHGHGDSFLIAAGSGAATFGEPDSLGVTQGVANDTLTVPYNDFEKLFAIVEANKNQIACIIIEPVAGNMGCVLPKTGYLQKIRELCTQNNIVYIFDEVMTGFRLSAGGAQGLFGVTPDLCTLGKIIGGGLPVGAYGGKAEIMNCVSPTGKVYQAGTLSGNPVALAAGIAMLTKLKQNPSIYENLNNITQKITSGIKSEFKTYNINLTINQIGSMYSLFFNQQNVTNFDDAKASNLNQFSTYFNEMLNRGVYLAPSQFESLFVSNAIENHDIDTLLAANKLSLKNVFDA